MDDLEVVHGWCLPPYYVYGLAADPEWHDEIVRQEAARLTEALSPWQQKYPSVAAREVPLTT